MKNVSDTIKKITSFFVKTTYSNKIATVILVLPLVIIIYLIYHYLSGMREGIVSNKEHEPSTCGSNNKEKGDATLYFFYADWCPHCTKAKPIIRDIKAKFDGRTINNKTITFKDIDCTVETQDTKRFIEKYNVESFPTIIIQTGDDTVKYDGKVEQEEFTKFIEQNIQ